MWRLQVVRDLHAAGHYIIISTARRMRTHNGMVPLAINLLLAPLVTLS